MAYGMNEWRLDWLVMNQRQSWYEAWLQSEDGFWDSPGVNASKTARVNTHGSVISPTWKTERAITLEGRAYANNDADVKRLAAAIKGICSDPYKTYKLSTHTEIGVLECQVKLDGPVLVNSGQDFSSSVTFSIQLVAPDPRIYNAEWQLMRTGLAQNIDGGLNFDYDSNADGVIGLDFATPGMKFGTSASHTGFVRLRNSGTAPAPVTYTVYGPLTNPTLTTSVNGASYSMRYNAELQSGEFVVIDPSAPAVLLGGTASRRELLSPAGFRGFAIPPMDPVSNVSGELSVGLTHTGPTTATGYFEAAWRSASW